MVAIVVCNRQSGKSRRHKIDGVNLAENVAEFKRKASQEVQVPVQDMELLYCGQSLKDECALDSYGVKAGVTLHLLKKHQQQENIVPEKMDDESIQQVVTALQTTLANPEFSAIVEKILHDPEAVENIIAASPGLDRDPVALAILQDSEMMTLLADPTHVSKLIDAHPSLGAAAMMVAAAVNEEGSKNQEALPSTSSRGTYSLDQMSDDDEYMPRMGMAPGASGAAITANQLAAALAAAGAGMSTGSPQQSTSGTPLGSASNSSSGSAITADFFRQAMASTLLAQAGEQVPPDVLQAQLAQLREMGITDEQVAKQALMASGGDLQTAIELLFGENME